MINVKEDKKNNKLVVTANLPKNVKQKLAITTSDIKKYLNDTKYDFDFKYDIEHDNP